MKAAVANIAITLAGTRLTSRSAKVAAAAAAAINLARVAYSFDYHLRHVCVCSLTDQLASPPSTGCLAVAEVVAHGVQALQRAVQRYHNLSQCLFLGGLEGLSAQTVRSYLKIIKNHSFLKPFFLNSGTL